MVRATIVASIANVCFAACMSLLSAQEPVTVDFVKDVRPIFQEHCYACHSGDQPSSSLRLDHKASAFSGGELYGTKLIQESSDDSLLLQVISDQSHETHMPPDGPPLSPDEIDIIRRWLEQGAQWPDGIDEVEIADPLDHWAFQPPRDTTVASLLGDWSKHGQFMARARSPLDLFIAKQLDNVGLKHSPEASRRAWLKRVTLDLTGLPPSWDEIVAFDSSTDADAYEQVVERLLASPRYGERFAQHWLDVVRYADTHGFEVNTERPNAWPYRDYVIESFNNDTPYDSFIQQQIAGDSTGHDAATGFLITASVLLPGQIGQDEPSKRLARQDALDEIVVNIGQTFLGLSIGCARCHNHKFDPVSQVDYFGMQAFVAGVEYEDRIIKDADADERASDLRVRFAELNRRLAEHVPLFQSGAQRPSVNARHNIDRFPSRRVDRVRFTVLATNRLEPCIDELQIFDSHGMNVARATDRVKVIASGSNTTPDRHELRFVNDGQFGNSRSWMSNEVGGGWIEIQLGEATEVERVDWGRDRFREYSDRLPIQYRIEGALGDDNWFLLSDHTDRAQYDEGGPQYPIIQVEGLQSSELQIDVMQQEYDVILAEIRSNPDGGRPVFAGVFRNPDDIRLLRRGDPEQPQQPVPPSIPNIFGNLGLDSAVSEIERRRTLAAWIASKENPLTARVMVNRIWQSHFGVGLVETSNDFGRNGSPPSHLELLDYLADRFQRSGWSIKAMHREIVLSSTYRQSSVPHEAGNNLDSEVRLLWRYPMRRLEGETLRDSLLASTGQLSLTMGGSGFDLFDKRGGLTGFEPIEKLLGTNNRRMIFAHRVRRERDAVFGAFDCPDGGQSLPIRRESTTPIQALNLLNSSIVLEVSSSLDKSIVSSSTSDAVDSDKTVSNISEIYKRILGRFPSAQEIEIARPYVSQHGLALLCRALFNSNEYLYLH
ncbi:PSD1 and planctomycete cytochrome C domain-containing protein [Pirellulaceae bacterium SH449]